ncbi:MAG: HEAT repeat domain-containing protein [Myxococcaceae bacterium]
MGLLAQLAVVLTVVSAEPELPPSTRGAGVRCKTVCEAHVKDRSLRANVCGRCFLEGGAADRGAWVMNLPPSETESKKAAMDALEDPDWAVRWGGVRALAAMKGVPELNMLAALVRTAEGPELSRMELTAAHVGGLKKVTTANLLKAAGRDGPAAAARIWADREAVRKVLEQELYGTDPGMAEEALGHLAVFLQIPEGRVVLNAMSSRPPSTDSIVAEVLKRRALNGGAPAGLVLIKGALPEQKPYVDRLFAIFGEEVIAARQKLSSADADQRKEAARELWALGPLGAQELERLIADEAPVVRLVAARGLAAGEGRTVAEAARARLSGEGGLSQESLQHWIEAIGAAGGETCEKTLTEIVEDQKLPAGSRGAALMSLGPCAGAKALPLVTKAMGDSSAEVRAGAAMALSYMPRSTDAEAAATKALGDPEPAVVAAAVRTIGAQRQAGKLEQLMPLLDHPNAKVRAASVVACSTLGGAKVAQAIAKRLTEDSDADVRGEAAKALGDLGGPFAPGALGSAAAKDPDSRVRYLAKASMRRLGFGQ